VPSANQSYFRPYNNVTRGQVTKMVILAFGLTGPAPTTSTFQDVPVNSTFFYYVERAVTLGIVSGYPCGGPNEPCVPPTNKPYFRPGNNVTRGQITKIDSLAAGWSLIHPAVSTFQDVPEGSTFYEYVETAADQGVISGYPCGSPGEPCVAPANKPYFRPGGNATRGQISKIIYLSQPPGVRR
jgi:hypothetical protein